MLGDALPQVHALDDMSGPLVRWQASCRWQRQARVCDPAEAAALSGEAASLLASWLSEAGPAVSLTLQLGAAPEPGRMEISLQVAVLGLAPEEAHRDLAEAVADLSAALLLGGASGPWEPAPEPAPAGRGSRVLIRDWDQPLPEAPTHGGFLPTSDRLGDLVRLLSLVPGPRVALTLRARPPATGVGALVAQVDRVAADPRQKGLGHLAEHAWRVVEQGRMWSIPALDAQVALLAGDTRPSPLVRAVVREALGGPAPHLLSWQAAPTPRLAALAAGGHRALAAVPVDDDLPGPWRGDAAAGLLRAVTLRDEELDALPLPAPT